MSSIDLSPFIGRDPFRPYLTAPFSVGEFTYATDGIVIVRVARLKNVDELPKDSVLKDPDKVVAGAAKAFYASPPSYKLPPAPPADLDCETCAGRGKVHSCPDCDCICDVCSGSGKQASETKVSTEFDGVNFGLRYLRKVLALPGIEFSKPHFPEQMFFRFDGGVGALMPLRSKYSQHVEIFDGALTSAK
jgi:hypothetical protein